MKATELRIGNIVKVIKPGGYNNVGDLIIINSVDKNGVNHWQDMGATGCNTFDGIEGIALTEELLEKCGFKSLGNDGHISKGKNGEVPVLWGINDSGPLFCRYENGKFYLISKFYPYEYAESPSYQWDFEKQSTCIYCLHQLQNLYNDLTGTELEINP